jgi:hypothetical protein
VVDHEVSVLKAFDDAVDGCVADIRVERVVERVEDLHVERARLVPGRDRIERRGQSVVVRVRRRGRPEADEADSERRLATSASLAALAGIHEIAVVDPAVAKNARRMRTSGWTERRIRHRDKSIPARALLNTLTRSSPPQRRSIVTSVSRAKPV